jgi:putative FmdB family regulatory protein
MPVYDYQCVECGGRDQRVAGIDDATALCVSCGGLMLRLDEDIFQPYFREAVSSEQETVSSNCSPLTGSK